MQECKGGKGGGGVGGEREGGAGFLFLYFYGMFLSAVDLS